MDEMPKEEEIEIWCNELKTFVEMLNTNPQELLTKQVLLMISPSLIDEDKDEAKDILNWWKDSITTKQLMEFLFKRDHKVNGDYNNWSCGFLGSRWADTKINQKIVALLSIQEKVMLKILLTIELRKIISLL